MKFWRIWNGYFKLNIAEEMAYRLNFLLKTIAFVIFDMFGPLLALIIYGISKGLPGWTFEEFLFLQGTFTLSTGLLHVLFVRFSGRVIEGVRDGRFDIELVKPANPLLLALATSSDLDGLPRTIMGVLISTYALVKMGWIFNLMHLLAYAALIFGAVLFLLSLQIIIAAMAFIFVRTYTLWNIFDILIDIGKNPTTVFGPVGMLLFTFAFPIALAAFYPAAVILGKISIMQTLMVVSIAFAFFGFSVLLWHLGIRKYGSAGG
jgi:ABC-2 type transport system permease protein